MNRKPLTILTALVVAGAAGLGYVTRDKWGAPVPVATAPVPAEAPKVAEAAKPAETPKVEEAAKPVEQQVATAQPPAEVASEPAAPAVQPPAAETPKPDAAVPSFDTVRIEPDGSAVIAGRAAPGSEVTVKLNGAVVATGTANADGAFAIVPDKPMPAGAGVLSLEMKSADGKMASSEQTVAVAGKATGEAAPTVAILKPDAPTKIIQSGGTEAAKLPPMASVNIDAVDYDEQGNMVFGGRGPAGNKVQLYMDNQPLAEGVIGADGTWTIAPTAQIAVGAHALRADEIGNDGAVKSRVEIPFFREEAAKVLASRAPAPEQPATRTEETTVTVTTPDKQTTVTATAPVTVEVKEEPAKPAEVAVAEPVKPAEPEKPAETAAAEPVKPVELAKPAETVAAEPAKPAEAAAAEPAKPAEPAPQVAAAQPETPAAEPVPDAKIIIQPGNNLWKLSRKIYGKGVMYTVIYEANREYIRNPNLIYPGQIFVTPRGPDTASGQ